MNPTKSFHPEALTSSARRLRSALNGLSQLTEAQGAALARAEVLAEVTEEESPRRENGRFIADFPSVALEHQCPPDVATCGEPGISGSFSAAAARARPA